MAKPRPSCWDKAGELLSIRPHFRRELEIKLARREYTSDEIERTLERCDSYGYLDDRKAAAQWVATKSARGPVGAQRLIAELTKRGVDSDLAREVVAEQLPEDDLEPTREAARRWLARKRKPQRASLARHLQHKGFSARSISSVLEDELPWEHQQSESNRF